MSVTRVKAKTVIVRGYCGFANGRHLQLCALWISNYIFFFISKSNSNNYKENFKFKIKIR